MPKRSTETRYASRCGCAVCSLAACLILVFQASASRMLKIDEKSIGIPGLHAIPWQLGPWKASAEQSIGPEIDSLSEAGRIHSAGLCRPMRAARPSTCSWRTSNRLQNTYGPHSPRICLPGSGWLVSSSKIVNIPVPGRAGGYSGQPIHDGESQPAHPGSVLVPKRPGCLGRRVSRQVAPVAGPDPVPALRRQPGAVGNSRETAPRRTRSGRLRAIHRLASFHCWRNILRPSTRRAGILEYPA